MYQRRNCWRQTGRFRGCAVWLRLLGDFVCEFEGWASGESYGYVGEKQVRKGWYCRSEFLP